MGTWWYEGDQGKCLGSRWARDNAKNSRKMVPKHAPPRTSDTDDDSEQTREISGIIAVEAGKKTQDRART